MCVKCGGTCGGRRRGPRFVSHPVPTSMEVVGTADSVERLPDGLIEVRGGMITYEDLYTGLGPDGQPSTSRIPGTFGNYATRAQVGR